MIVAGVEAVHDVVVADPCETVADIAREQASFGSPACPFVVVNRDGICFLDQQQCCPAMGEHDGMVTGVVLDL